MLDVHPPEHPAHSWTDFFIHMGTICLGLLIALTLEQTVEHLHHRHEVEEALHAVDEERANNRRAIAADTATFRANAEMLRNNLLVLTFLKGHPGTPDSKLPGILRFFGAEYAEPSDQAWQSAKQASLIQDFPQKQAADLTNLYFAIQGAHDSMLEVWRDFNEGSHFAYVNPRLSLLTPEEIASEIALTEKCMDANFRYGIWLSNIRESFPDFSGGPTVEEALHVVRPLEDGPSEAELAIPARETAERLAPLFAKANEATHAVDRPAK